MPVLALVSEVTSLPSPSFAVGLGSRPRDPDVELARQLCSALGCGHSLPGCLS